MRDAVLMTINNRNLNVHSPIREIDSITTESVRSSRVDANMNTVCPAHSSMDIATSENKANRPEASVQMDVFIAGIGRSGSTLLANLLTKPQQRWILVEPGLTRHGMGDHVRRQAERFGIQIAPDEWQGPRRDESALQRFQRTLQSHVGNIRWGVKEVNMTGADELINIFRPKAVLLSVRNIRDCAISIYEKNQAVGQISHSEEWMVDRLLSAANALIRFKRALAQNTLRVVRYEEFVSDPGERVRLAEWLNWPVDGDPAWCMDIFGRQNEPNIHGNKIGTSSINRGARIANPTSLNFAQKVMRLAEEYQVEFGYELTDISHLAPVSISTARNSSQSNIGHRHLNKIISCIKPGFRALELNAGDPTFGIADNLPLGATLASISDKQDDDFKDSTLAANQGQFDIIICNGKKGVSCLQQAKQLLAPDGIVFLYDAQRACYDQAKTAFIEHGHMGPCADYPFSQLWWGGNLQARPAKINYAAYPLIVSFYTEGSEYEIEAQRLRESCRKLNLSFEIVGIKPTGSWEQNCAQKASFVQEMWKCASRPVLWIDADGMLHRQPDLLTGISADFAIHKWNGWKFASGTVYFNQTEMAGLLLDRWAKRCQRFPSVLDQVSLDLAWEDTVNAYPLETLWLPRSYCQIFDKQLQGAGENIVVEHFQASRRLRSHISSEQVATSRPKTTRDLFVARMASRPRRFMLSKADAACLPEHYDVLCPNEVLSPSLECSLPESLVEKFRNVHKAGRALLVGYGLSMTWRLLNKYGIDAICVEDSKEMRNLAIDFSGPRIVQGTALTIPYENNAFTSSLCVGQIELYSDEEVDVAITEMLRVTMHNLVLCVCLQPDSEDRWPFKSYRDDEWWSVRLRNVIHSTGEKDTTISIGFLDGSDSMMVLNCCKNQVRPIFGGLAPINSVAQK